MNPQIKDAHSIGEAAVAVVVCDVLMQGLQPFVAVEDKLPFDVVVSSGDGHTLRVQVKGVGEPRSQGPMPGAYQWSLRKGRGAKEAYNKDDLDVFALVAVDIRMVHYVPIGDLVKPQGVITTVNKRADQFQRTFPHIQGSTE